MPDQDKAGHKTELADDVEASKPAASHPSESDDNDDVSSSSSKPTATKKQVQRKQPQRKPKGMPRRPLSGYNFFFREQRAKIVAERDEAREQGVASPYINERVDLFTQLGKIIGKRWKALSADERSKFERMADDDMVRYRREMTIYHQQQADQVEKAARPPLAAGASHLGPTQGGGVLQGPPGPWAAGLAGLTGMSNPSDSMAIPQQGSNPMDMANLLRGTPGFGMTGGPGTPAYLDHALFQSNLGQGNQDLARLASQLLARQSGSLDQSQRSGLSQTSTEASLGIGGGSSHRDVPSHDMTGAQGAGNLNAQLAMGRSLGIGGLGLPPDVLAQLQGRASAQPDYATLGRPQGLPGLSGLSGMGIPDANYMNLLRQQSLQAESLLSGGAQSLGQPAMSAQLLSQLQGQQQLQQGGVPLSASASVLEEIEIMRLRRMQQMERSEAMRSLPPHSNTALDLLATIERQRLQQQQIGLGQQEYNAATGRSAAPPPDPDIHPPSK